MAYYKNPIIYPTGRISQDTAKINENFTELAKSFVNEDPTTYKVINADKVDDYHANQIPMPNTIPVSDNTGKLNLNWIPQGSGSGLNADQVDGFHASQTPTPNTIPVAGDDGKLNAGWLPINFETYSRLTVGTSLPASPQHNDLFYNTSNNTLQRYNARTNTWTSVDWQTIVRASPEWQAGRLRINSSTGRLEISPDGTNWYPCIPAVGSQAIELASIDNTNYSLLYWIAPGQTVIIRNANHVPIVYAKDVVPFFSGSYFNSFAYELWIGLRPSNVAISDGDGQWLAGGGTGVGANRSTSLSIVPILEQSNTTQNWANFELRILPNNRFLANVVGQGAGGYQVIVCNNSGTASATSYWLGTWFNQDGAQFVVGYLTLTRRA